MEGTFIRAGERIREWQSWTTLLFLLAVLGLVMAACFGAGKDQV